MWSRVIIKRHKFRVVKLRNTYNGERGVLERTATVSRCRVFDAQNFPSESRQVPVFLSQGVKTKVASATDGFVIAVSNSVFRTNSLYCGHETDTCVVSTIMHWLGRPHDLVDNRGRRIDNHPSGPIVLSYRARQRNVAQEAWLYQHDCALARSRMPSKREKLVRSVRNTAALKKHG